MTRWLLQIALTSGVFLASVCRAEMSADDLTALARKVRASVMFILVSNDSGRTIATGTGFIVSDDGKLITNRHVANAGPQIVVHAPGGRKYRVLGALAEDSDQDLVVLQLEDKRLPPVTLGASDNVSVGAPVLMVGSPLAMESTVQEGTVSGFRKFFDQRRWIEITAALASGKQDINSRIIHGQGLQVTTAVAPGSSGSPVFNANGEVIGVITAIERAENPIALAIPVEAVKELIARAARVDQPKPLGALTRRGGNDLATDVEYDAAAKAYNAHDYEEAESRAKTVVARYPDSPSALLLLGQIYLQRRSYSDAGDSFDRAIQLKRDLAPAWFGRALADWYQGSKEHARDALRELQKLDPTLAKKLIDAIPALAH